MKTFRVTTSRRDELVDLTAEIQEVVLQSGVRSGLCTVFVPHTTAGVTINEHADGDVARDILASLERQVPWRDGYKHGEGNSAAHIKASLMGSSVTVLLEEGRLALGAWQGIFFAEFDGPRSRKVYVKISSG
jgi:secondary thiamine-phosphate synthase enzyme